jgi:hypothetical protein
MPCEAARVGSHHLRARTTERQSGQSLNESKLLIPFHPMVGLAKPLPLPHRPAVDNPPLAECSIWRMLEERQSTEKSLPKRMRLSE